MMIHTMFLVFTKKGKTQAFKILKKIYIGSIILTVDKLLFSNKFMADDVGAFVVNLIIVGANSKLTNNC